MLRFDAEQAAANLADLPALLARANAAERRAVVRSVFEQVWVREKALSGLTPRVEVYPLMGSISRCVYGVADGSWMPVLQKRTRIPPRRPLVSVER